MAFLGTFIGIDRHLAPYVRDLSCAKRDAIALWALFKDTIPDIKDSLLLDENATCQNILKALNDTLDSATEDDIIFLSFSGHGSPDHRLVAHDSTRETALKTTIQMSEVAERFRKSKAKTIIFLLDCCFSGQAPARVWEDAPATRDDSFSIDSIGGAGRILIAASSKNQPALENAGHGLLTRAFIQSMLSEEKTVSLPQVIDESAKVVRAEASKLGSDQYSVWFGHIEGGLTLPSFQKGAFFFQAFPELKGAKISNKIDDLSLFGIPNEILSEWKNNFIDGLNALQLQAVNDFRILDGTSALVVAPTSSGKTFIGEMASIRAMMQGKKSVFLLPYRALVNEKYDYFSALYQEKLNMRVIRCTGDYTDQAETFIKGKYDLALFTYEMFLNLIVSNPNVLTQIELIVLDEAQFITDPTRGISVELLLTYIMTSREKGLAPQLLLLSAVIGGINDFDKWLGLKSLITSERPVPLIEGVLDRTGQYQFVDVSGKPQLTQLLPHGHIYQRGKDASAQDVIVPLAKKIISENPHEKMIIFRNMRGTAEGCAGYLSKELGLPPVEEVLAALPQHDRSSTSERLRECLSGGTAFHTSNLNRQERIMIERAFRIPNSKIRVLGATTTVAAGINTPASTVILAENEFIGEEGRPFTVAEYKNMAGRAGRLGFREQGKSIILAETPHERELLFQRYVLGKVEAITSTFNSNEIQTWLIRLLAQVPKVLEDEVIRLLANTYGGFLAIREHPEWRGKMAEKLKEYLDHMIELRLVERESGFIRLTLLGRACGQSSLSFNSAMRLVELLRRCGREKITSRMLMALIQALPEMDSVYTPLFKKGQKESIRPREVLDRFGHSVVNLLQNFVDEDFHYLARCKRVSILSDWIEGISIDEIEKNYSTTPFAGRIGYGDVRRFADAARFHLRSAYKIACLMLLNGIEDEKDFDELIKQLELGLPKEALELLQLPIPLERGEYLALYERGVKNLADFCGYDEDVLNQILDSSRTSAIKALQVKKG